MADVEEKSYETRDFTVRAVALFFGGVVILGLLALVAMFGLIRMMTERQGVGGASVMAKPDPAQDPPAPRLQIAPIQEWQQMRAEEEAQLQNYSWIDREKGIAAIPIERAMELLVERGARERPAPTQKSAAVNKEQP